MHTSSSIRMSAGIGCTTTEAPSEHESGAVVPPWTFRPVPRLARGCGPATRFTSDKPGPWSTLRKSKSEAQDSLESRVIESRALDGALGGLDVFANYAVAIIGQIETGRARTIRGVGRAHH